MSQHLFETTMQGKPITILMGWDRPLQGFFMVIDYNHIDLDEPLWSNLNQTESHPKTLDQFIQVLNDFKFDSSVPQQMFDAVLQDQRENCGNKEVIHSMLDGVYGHVLGNAYIL